MAAEAHPILNWRKFEAEWNQVIELPKFLYNLPNWLFGNWAEYKGQTYFVNVDVQKSLACHRPIIDLSYCATESMNGLVLRSVNYKPRHFKKSKLAEPQQP